jgi:hypothetical protein
VKDPPPRRLMDKLKETSPLPHNAVTFELTRDDLGATVSDRDVEVAHVFASFAFSLSAAAISMRSSRISSRNRPNRLM